MKKFIEIYYSDMYLYIINIIYFKIFQDFLHKKLLKNN